MNSVIAEIVPSLGKELEEHYNMLDAGFIRKKIKQIFESNGYTIEEDMDYFKINNEVELRLTDSFIKDMTMFHNFIPTDFFQFMESQYKELIDISNM